ncbi:hypothetical protein ADUPG1_013286 [Aduncisulcus paluster]|uniref:Uncharacterized protein n=1 Tax=Aduncisulcus paluster TaxID=2918883 RepID=A0ABQ5K2D8_9EUKA|nr:hypothetical protein ADUPG1_013286 [Aduncisulcus paluster]
MEDFRIFTKLACSRVREEVIVPSRRLTPKQRARSCPRHSNRSSISSNSNKTPTFSPKTPSTPRRSVSSHRTRSITSPLKKSQNSTSSINKSPFPPSFPASSPRKSPRKVTYTSATLQTPTMSHPPKTANIHSLSKYRSPGTHTFTPRPPPPRTVSHTPASAPPTLVRHSPYVTLDAFLDKVRPSPGPSAYSSGPLEVTKKRAWTARFDRDPRLKHISYSPKGCRELPNISPLSYKVKKQNIGVSFSFGGSQHPIKTYRGGLPEKKEPLPDGYLPKRGTLVGHTIGRNCDYPYISKSFSFGMDKTPIIAKPAIKGKIDSPGPLHYTVSYKITSPTLKGGKFGSAARDSTLWL